MVPIVLVVGRSDSGKTTLIVKLISELKQRGYKVGTIKHHTGDFEIDRPGKDTWRHAQAGADAVVISSPNKLAVIKRVEDDFEIDSVAGLLDGVDIIIAEGYKHARKPKIEVLRLEKYSTPLCDANDEVIAVVSDRPQDVSVKAPVLDWNDVKTLADLIEEKFLCRND